MIYTYQIEQRGSECSAYRNGHLLDVGGIESRQTPVVMAALLAEHFCLGPRDLDELRRGGEVGPSVRRVRRLADVLADVFAAGRRSFELAPQELDEILAAQVRCWEGGDLTWIPSDRDATGWIPGHVEEVRHLKTGTQVFVKAATDSGMLVSGRCAPGELAHRSKGGRAPWKR